MHGDDIGVRLAAQHERDLADRLAGRERREHDRLAAVVRDHRDLARRDEVQARSLLPLRRRASRPSRRCASRSARRASALLRRNRDEHRRRARRGSRPSAAGSAPRARRPPRAASRRPPRAPRAWRRGGSTGASRRRSPRAARATGAPSRRRARRSTRRARIMGLPSSSVGRRRTSSSPRATMYASAPSSPSSMTTCPAGTVIISKAPTRSRSASLGRALKSGSGRREEDLRAGRVVVLALGGVDDLRRLRRERGAGEKRAERLEAVEVRAAAAAAPRSPSAGPTPGRTRSRPRRGGCVTSTPSARRSPMAATASGRFPPSIARRTRELEALDRGLGAAHLLEQAARDDERARHRRIPLDDRGAPAQRGLGLVREQQRERAIDRRVGRLGAGQVRRGDSHGGAYPITARPVLSCRLRSAP